MIQRQLWNELLQSAKDYPVVTVIGPRQAGKTTLVKMAFPDYDYCNNTHNEQRAHMPLGNTTPDQNTVLRDRLHCNVSVFDKTIKNVAPGSAFPGAIRLADNGN